MKRLGILALTCLFMLNCSLSKADEGMWLLSLLGKNYEKMKKQGFKLTPEDIYSVNHGSLKDAVIGLGNEGSPFGIFAPEKLFPTKDCSLPTTIAVMV